MSTPKINGIVLVRNEDLFVRRAITNIIGFCDEILLCDNGSTDGTASILREFSTKYPKISYHALRHPSESHDLLQRFVGTRSWVFAVDGDEIYDPMLLKGFRLRVLAGEFDAFWRMKGNVLHCTELAADHSTASGYMSPPSRSMTKLYNFAAINAWNGKVLERLHGGEISFKEGFHDLVKNNFQESLGWEETPLRCLHLCFLQRSTQEAPAFSEGHRQNIQEIYGGGILGNFRRLLNRIFFRQSVSAWKQDYYRQGAIEKIDATPFFK